MTTLATSTTFERSFDLPAPVAVAFAALTDHAKLQRWWAEHAQVEPRIGGAYRFWGRHTIFAPAAGDVDQVITAFDPPRHLAYRWNWRGMLSVVSISLTDRGKNTQLQVRHTLDGVFPEFTCESRELLQDLWIVAVGNLRSFLRTGEPASMPDYSTRGDTVQCNIMINAAPEKVFAALTDPAKMDCWLSKTAAVDARAGGAYSYGWSLERDGTNQQCGPTKIIAIEPNRSLTHDWVHPNEPNSRVTWTIEPVGKQTRVTILHHRSADAVLNNAYQQGWTGFLVQLQAYLETGKTLS